MLKRINVHLDDVDLKDLDAILSKMKGEKNAEWGIHDAKRATLIRYAIAYTFGFEYRDRYPSASTLKKALKKAVKNTA